MTEVAYFENITTKKRYKVLDMTTDENDRSVVRLQGPNRAFDEPYDKAHFQEMGYRLVRVEENDDEG